MSDLPTLVLIKETNKKVRAAFEEHFSSLSPDGVGPQEGHLMFYIYSHPNATSADLQAFQGRAKSSVSESLSILAEKGYIEYVCNPDDRREKRILVTESGKAAMEEAHNRIKSVEQQLLEGVGEEEERFLRKALERIKANAERSNDGQQ